jgi:hypothetical protein
VGSLGFCPGARIGGQPAAHRKGLYLGRSAFFFGPVFVSAKKNGKGGSPIYLHNRCFLLDLLRWVDGVRKQVRHLVSDIPAVAGRFEQVAAPGKQVTTGWGPVGVEG